ncbi:hypothetical protein [Bacillus methanolicus]|nr:hypothetical protein [Bacillus methanolicus]
MNKLLGHGCRQSLSEQPAIDLIRKETKRIVMEDIAVEKEYNKSVSLGNVEQEVEISKKF